MATNTAKGRVPRLTLGDRLMLAREHAHITSSDMAKRLKCSRHTITNYERGRTEPSHAVILEWSRQTRYDLGWLLDGQIETEEAVDQSSLKAELAQALVAQLLGTSLRGRDSNSQPTGWSPADEARFLLEPNVILDLTADPARIIPLSHLAPTG